MIWFTSDTHFNHTNIIKYCNRPFSDITEMNNQLVQNWNSKVNKGDTVYHLGDVGFGEMTHYYLRQLNGRKILIKGNHDVTLSDRRLSDNFCEIYDRFEVEFDGYKIEMVHDPKNAETDKFTLAGHVHDRWKIFPGKLNVGVDVWHFNPVSWDVVSRRIAEDKDTEEYNKSKRGWHNWFDYIDKLEEKLFVQEMFDDKDHIKNLIQGALKSTIYKHGSISEDGVDSASKRIYGQLKGYLKGDQ